MLAVLVWVTIGALVSATLWNVLRRIRSNTSQRIQTQQIREFVDSVAREVCAGSRAELAAGHAAEAVTRSDIKEQLQCAVLQVKLGEQPQKVSLNHPLAAYFFHVWGLSVRYGVALGQIAEHTVEDIDAQLARRASASSAMAGARLTVIVLLSLPCGAVVMGNTLGLNTIALLATNTLGNLLLLVGVILACAGVWWTESLSVTILGGVGGRAGPAEEDPLEAARILDVFAAAITSGLPLVQAWKVATEGLTGEITLVTTLLELGAGEEAWASVEKHEMFGPVVRQAAQHTRAGSIMAAGARSQAARLRRLAADQATAGAEKILVVIAAPLTLCFLPAFVLVGLIPLVIGLAGI